MKQKINPDDIMSAADKFVRLPQKEQNKILSKFTPKQVIALKYDWEFLARPKQYQFIVDNEWDIYIYLAGRGAGKSKSGSEWTRHKAETDPGCRIGVIAPTTSAVNDVCVKGSSGIIAACPPNSIEYKPSAREIRWKNGSIVNLISADAPDRIRGFNFNYVWLDELSSFRYSESFDMVRMALRIGQRPQMLITTTPKVNDLTLKILDMIDKYPNKYKMVVASTYENPSLPDSYLEQAREYEGTALGDQEFYAIVNREIDGALWKREWIKHYPHYDAKKDLPVLPPIYIRTVISVDIATTDSKTSDETVITVMSEGMYTDDEGKEHTGYFVRDVTGVKMTPGDWAELIAQKYFQYEADVIIVETNQGGDMIRETIENVKTYTDFNEGKRKSINGKDLPIKEVHAKKGKKLRAEPVSFLYQRGRVFHMANFTDLETQMIHFTGSKNDRDDYVDSLVYGLRELSGIKDYTAFFKPLVGGYRPTSDLELL